MFPSSRRVWGNSEGREGKGGEEGERGEIATERWDWRREKGEWEMMRWKMGNEGQSG